MTRTATDRDQDLPEWRPRTRTSVIGSLGFLFCLPYLLSGFQVGLAPVLLIGVPMLGLSSLIYLISAIEDISLELEVDENEDDRSDYRRRSHSPA